MNKMMYSLLLLKAHLLDMVMMVDLELEDTGMSNFREDPRTKMD